MAVEGHDGGGPMDLFAADVVEDGKPESRVSGGPSVVVVGGEPAPAPAAESRRAEEPRAGTLGAARAERAASQPRAAAGEPVAEDDLASGIAAVAAATAEPAAEPAPGVAPPEPTGGVGDEPRSIVDAVPEQAAARTGVERLRVKSDSSRPPRARASAPPRADGPAAPVPPSAPAQPPPASSAQRPASPPPSVVPSRAAAAVSAEVPEASDEIRALAAAVADEVEYRFGVRPWWSFIVASQGLALVAAGMVLTVVALGAGWFAGSMTTHAAMDAAYEKRLGSVPYLQAAAKDPVGQRWIEMLGVNSRTTIEGILSCNASYGLKRVAQSEVPGCAGGSADVNHAWRMLPDGR